MSTHARENEPGHGRHAHAPTEMPAKAWKDILWRTWGEISEDSITLVAAGATYFLLLALFPTIVAFVSIYGLFADASTVSRHVALLSGIVPAGGMSLIDEQLTRITQQGPVTLGWGLVLSLGLALWSSSSGVKTLFEAMNIAYDEREKRSFLHLNALALLFTVGVLLAAIVMIGVVVVLPAVLGAIGLSRGFEWLVQALGYGLLLVMLLVGIAALYRLGPSRQQAKWRWLTPGAVLAVMVIIAASLLFSWYSANFANYEKTYGSLGALIGFLTWMWISVTVIDGSRAQRGNRTSDCRGFNHRRRKPDGHPRGDEGGHHRQVDARGGRYIGHGAKSGLAGRLRRSYGPKQRSSAPSRPLERRRANARTSRCDHPCHPAAGDKSRRPR